ncbi:hypothetical protein HK102_006828 [Quaeritorhiza haematococci]|nr:hypothetical protein HK102_006828 [Quaeritorhiza haematococci]
MEGRNPTPPPDDNDSENTPLLIDTHTRFFDNRPPPAYSYGPPPSPPYTPTSAYSTDDGADCNDETPLIRLRVSASAGTASSTSVTAAAAEGAHTSSRRFARFPASVFSSFWSSGTTVSPSSAPLSASFIGSANLPSGTEDVDLLGLNSPLPQDRSGGVPTLFWDEPPPYWADTSNYGGDDEPLPSYAELQAEDEDNLFGIAGDLIEKWGSLALTLLFMLLIILIGLLAILPLWTSPIFTVHSNPAVMPVRTSSKDPSSRHRILPIPRPVGNTDIPVTMGDRSAGGYDGKSNRFLDVDGDIDDFEASMLDHPDFRYGAHHSADPKNLYESYMSSSSSFLTPDDILRVVREDSTEFYPPASISKWPSHTSSAKPAECMSVGSPDFAFSPRPFGFADPSSSNDKGSTAAGKIERRARKNAREGKMLIAPTWILDMRRVKHLVLRGSWFGTVHVTAEEEQDVENDDVSGDGDMEGESTVRREREVEEDLKMRVYFHYHVPHPSLRGAVVFQPPVELAEGPGFGGNDGVYEFGFTPNPNIAREHLQCVRASLRVTIPPAWLKKHPNLTIDAPLAHILLNLTTRKTSHQQNQLAQVQGQSGTAAEATRMSETRDASTTAPRPVPFWVQRANLLRLGAVTKGADRSVDAAISTATRDVLPSLAPIATTPLVKGSEKNEHEVRADNGMIFSSSQMDRLIVWGRTVRLHGVVAEIVEVKSFRPPPAPISFASAIVRPSGTPPNVEGEDGENDTELGVAGVIGVKREARIYSVGHIRDLAIQLFGTCGDKGARCVGGEEKSGDGDGAQTRSWGDAAVDTKTSNLLVVSVAGTTEIDLKTSSMNQSRRSMRYSIRTVSQTGVIQVMGPQPPTSTASAISTTSAPDSTSKRRKPTRLGSGHIGDYTSSLQQHQLEGQTATLDKKRPGFVEGVGSLEGVTGLDGQRMDDTRWGEEGEAAHGHSRNGDIDKTVVADVKVVAAKGVARLNFVA